MSDEKSYPQMRREFHNLYVRKIIPKVRPYENERKQKRILAIIVAVIFWLLGLFFIVLSLPLDSNGSGDCAKLGIFLCGLGILIPYQIKKDFENKIKERIMPSVCRCFGRLEWVPDEDVKASFYTDAKLVQNFNTESFDDIFKGRYKDVPITVAECHLTYVSGSGKNRTERTVFKGVIVELNMNKNFKGNTIIQPNSLFHISPSGLIHTELEDPEFESKFDVYTDDEIEARYLITTSFMKRLNNMKVAFSANKVSCSFYEDKLLIGLHTNKDLFSIASLNKPIDDGRQYYTMFEEILSIIKLIDHFKMDQKIGL